MNKLNGGYIMIDGASSTLQADLKKAYETGRPVLYYESNKAYYARVMKEDNLYYVYKLNDYAKNYLIEIIVDESGDLPDNTPIELTLITKDDLLHINSQNADDAQRLYNIITAKYVGQCLVRPAIIDTYDVIGGYILEDNEIVLLYNDNNTIKKIQIDLGSVKVISTSLI